MFENYTKDDWLDATIKAARVITQGLQFLFVVVVCFSIAVVVCAGIMKWLMLPLVHWVFN